MAARWSPAPTMVSELRGHRQPIAKFRALTLAACLRARNATALNDQRNRPVFISSLTYTRARGGRRRALADGRTMVAGADDGLAVERTAARSLGVDAAQPEHI